MLKYTRADIQAFVDRGTFQRGLDYYSRGRVELLTHNPSADRIEALVDGTHAYRVGLYQNSEGLYGLCSCPVRHDCKHVVATALAWLHRHRSEEHTSELQSRPHLVCRLLLEKKN